VAYNLDVSAINNGGNRSLVTKEYVDNLSDGKVLTDITDIVPGYLNEKIIAGTGIEINLVSISGVNSLMISNTGFSGAGGTANRPSNPTIGLPYFDTDLGFPIWWNGSVLGWVNATGASV